LQAVAQEQHEVMLLIETALGASLFWGGWAALLLSQLLSRRNTPLLSNAPKFYVFYIIAFYLFPLPRHFWLFSQWCGDRLLHLNSKSERFLFKYLYKATLEKIWCFSVQMNALSTF
jgi:hypothetical protein